MRRLYTHQQQVRSCTVSGRLAWVRVWSWVGFECLFETSFHVAWDGLEVVMQQRMTLSWSSRLYFLSTRMTSLNHPTTPGLGWLGIGFLWGFFGGAGTGGVRGVSAGSNPKALYIVGKHPVTELSTQPHG